MNGERQGSWSSAHVPSTLTRRPSSELPTHPRPARGLADTPAPAPRPHPADSRAGQGDSGQQQQTVPARPGPAESSATGPRRLLHVTRPGRPGPRVRPHKALWGRDPPALRSGLPARTQNSFFVSRPLALAVPRPPPTPLSRPTGCCLLQEGSPQAPPQPRLMEALSCWTAAAHVPPVAPTQL